MPRRRRNSNRRKGFRLRLPVRLRYLLAAGAVLAIGGILVGRLEATGAWLDRQFPVTGVAVAGELRHQDREELARWLGRRIEGGFFSADLGRLRQALEDRPWVRRARLRRRWPGTLVVTVAEHRPAARWRAGPAQPWHLISRRGTVFRPEPAQAGGGLPALEGPRGRIGELRKRRVRLGERLAGDHAVTRMAVDARGDWSARLDGRVTVRFGRDHWRRRAARLARVDREWRLLEREVARIDLRYPDGLAVAVAEGAQPERRDRQGANAHGRPAAARTGLSASPRKGQQGLI